MHIGYSWESQKERDHYEDQDVGGCIILSHKGGGDVTYKYVCFGLDTGFISHLLLPTLIITISQWHYHQFTVTV
jgi:hypothetical protein